VIFSFISLETTRKNVLLTLPKGFPPRPPGMNGPPFPPNGGLPPPMSNGSGGGGGPGGGGEALGPGGIHPDRLRMMGTGGGGPPPGR
jgi:hypothetical protein